MDETYGPVSYASGLQPQHAMDSMTYKNDTTLIAEEIKKKLDHQEVV